MQRLHRPLLTRLGVVAISLAFMASSAAIAAPGTFRHGAICDASAGVALDSHHFVIADDETNELFIYRQGEAAPGSIVDLKKFLDVTGDAREADIEGAARVGDRIYFIGSHGNNDNGKLRKDRHALFHVAIEAAGGTPTLATPKARPWGGLLKALAEDSRYRALALKQAEKLAPKMPGGVSIEGLAATPEGGLLIGFRNPHSADHKAFVAQLENPSAVVDARAAPRFGDLIQLDLGQRGIRSIERVGNRYFIVAGPYLDAKDTSGAKDFALYAWNGKRDAPPVQLAVNLGSLGVEGLFASADGLMLHLISDDGRENIDGEDCKDAKKAKRGFRLLSVPIPG
ncbi:MAG: DUF3616 domain-containing protein [Beijerinckiaceae bacterium]